MITVLRYLQEFIVGHRVRRGQDVDLVVAGKLVVDCRRVVPHDAFAAAAVKVLEESLRGPLAGHDGHEARAHERRHVAEARGPPDGRVAGRGELCRAAGGGSGHAVDGPVSLLEEDVVEALERNAHGVEDHELAVALQGQALKLEL